MNVRLRILTLLFSLALHGTFAALGFAVSGTENAKPEVKVYRVSLAEFAPAGPVADTAAATAIKTPDPVPAVAPEQEPEAEPAPVPEPVPEPESEPEQELAKVQRHNKAPVVSPGPVKKKPRKPRKARKRKIKKKPRQKQVQKEVPAKVKNSQKRAASTTSATAPNATAREGRASKNGLRTIGGLSAYDADVVDQRPAIARKALPQYPVNARRRNLQGKVVVRIVVDTTGTPRQCAIHASAPAGVFDQAALAAARKTRFIPGKLQGHPVNTVILLPYYFALH